MKGKLLMRDKENLFTYFCIIVVLLIGKSSISTQTFKLKSFFCEIDFEFQKHFKCFSEEATYMCFLQETLKNAILWSTWIFTKNYFENCY